MKAHLTERYAKKAVAEGGKKTVIFDDEVAGFGLYLYPSGRKSFVLLYRIAGRQRWLTIGNYPEWSVTAAREEAKRQKREIDRGIDPLGERQEARAAATVRELIDRYCQEHLPKLAPAHAADQRSMLANYVSPAWGARKVADIQPIEVDRLLAKVAEGRARPHKEAPKIKRRKPLAAPRPTPIRANRVGEVLRKMFNCAVAWKMREDNPAATFAKRMENARERFLTLDEIDRLSGLMEGHENQRGVAIVRLLLLTGARLGEVRCARFDQFDLEHAVWLKQAATTKQRKVHRLPLSSAAVALIRARRAAVPEGCAWLFPGDGEDADKPVQDLRRFWGTLCKQAGLPGLRMHDLRHTYASLLISDGMPLAVIGKLLGHTQARTTERYAHLMDDPTRRATESVGEMLRPKLRLVSSK